MSELALNDHIPWWEQRILIHTSVAVVSGISGVILLQSCDLKILQCQKGHPPSGLTPLLVNSAPGSMALAVGYSGENDDK